MGFALGGQAPALEQGKSKLREGALGPKLRLRGYDAPPTPEQFVIGAHRDDGRRFVVRSDTLLSAFLEMEATLL